MDHSTILDLFDLEPSSVLPSPASPTSQLTLSTSHAPESPLPTLGTPARSSDTQPSSPNFGRAEVRNGSSANNSSSILSSSSIVSLGQLTSSRHQTSSPSFNESIPHHGGLCRIDGESKLTYVLEILLEDGSMHQLHFSRNDFNFATRLFAIMDTESRGFITMPMVKEFVTMRCPVLWRRDEDLRQAQTTPTSSESPTFDEVWQSVVQSSQDPRLVNLDRASLRSISIGVEAWMVFCRFIALAQYLEAKRRFSGRHLQQTMRQRNAPRGSELVVVDVPPAAPPVPLSAQQLANYERTVQTSLPLPELDLDHSLLAAHDIMRRRNRQRQQKHQQQQRHQHQHHNTQRQQTPQTGRLIANHDRVDIQLFGASLASRKGLSSASKHNTQSHGTEFCITYFRYEPSEGSVASPSDVITVRRSMEDMKWLHDTFSSHKVLGGTLCGRILPPFPGAGSGRHLSQKLTSEDSALATTSGAAIAAAAAGVGKLKKGIKSLWGNCVANATQKPGSFNASGTAGASHSKHKINQPKKRGIGRSSKVLPDNYYNPNSPECHVRQFERYLNYLLEHPALSTSFPLNTILKASQSGLVAAKESLDEHGRAKTEMNAPAPNLVDGRSLPFWPLSNTGSLSAAQLNLSWIRTAAQAAIALKVHGVLETSGLPAASARLQHASLPNYDSSRIAKWSEEDSPKRNRESQLIDVLADGADEHDNSFEDGVMHVRDELKNEAATGEEDGGYDLLPLPVPAPERAILNTGDLTSSERQKPKEGRYRYGSPTFSERLLHENECDSRSAFIGDIAVDENIDKLREVIGSVDSTLSRCLASSAGIGSARRECNELHLSIVQGFDSWEGLRGKFVSQRALLKGVTGMEQSIGVFEDSDLSFVDDMSWQTALAHSAVSAAEDVRSTVRAARTASNAKAAASAAADAAQMACEEETFASMEEARATQTRASIARSHAIHAAVVEHEAMTVKRRATMALAHDVKCWNNHRKREVLRTCLAYARSQHEATRRAVDAWSCLRDGFIGSTAFPLTRSRWAPKQEEHSSASIFAETGLDDGTGTIYENSSEEGVDVGSPKRIVPVEHELLKIPEVESKLVDLDFTESESREPETILPLVVASPIIEEGEDLDESGVNENAFAGSVHSSIVTANTSRSQEKRKSTTDLARSLPGNFRTPTRPNSDTDDQEPLTASMQSLVDGLMSWGGQYDAEDDMALPMGMAASIVMEGSGVLGSQSSSV